MKILIIEIILLIIFLIFFTIGFYLIYRQVALVKKGEFRNKDRFQCIIYGFIFSLAVLVVIAVAFIFAVKTPELWESTPPDIHPLVLLIPFVSCLIYITVYPLIDFLFIALSKETDEGLTPFHRFISLKLINRFKTKAIAILVALFFYIFIFPKTIIGTLEALRSETLMFILFPAAFNMVSDLKRPGLPWCVL